MGQQHVTQTLTNAIAADRVAHAMLFAGPRGTGKTTIARIMAKAMNCAEGPLATPCNRCTACREITAGNSADVFEIDGASNNSVDQVRELRENARYKPAYSRHKIYIIDEVHMLSMSAFNALLKTLEEPPSHVLFMFATTEPQKIPVTILSRCQRHDLRRIRLNRIVDHMQMICEKEAVTIPEESLALIAKESGGSMRDALSLLDQVIVSGEDDIQHETVLDILGAVDQAIVEEMAAGLLNNDIPLLLKWVDEAYHHGQDLYRFFSDLLGHMRLLLALKLAPDAQMEEDLPGLDSANIKEAIADTSVEHLGHLFEALYREEPGMRRATHPKMALEMILIKVGQIKPVLPVGTLIEKLDGLRREMYQLGSPGDDLPAKAVKSIRPAKTAPPALESSPADDPVPSEETVENSPSKKDVWQTIVAKVGETAPSLAASLAESQLKSQDEDTLTVRMQGKPFDVTRINKTDNLKLIAKAAREVIGDSAKVLFDTGGVQKSKNQRSNITQRELELRQKALNHPMVEEALHKFEGEFVTFNARKDEIDEEHGKNDETGAKTTEPDDAPAGRTGR